MRNIIVIGFIAGGLLIGLAASGLVSYIGNLAGAVGLNFALKDYLTATFVAIAIGLALIVLPFSSQVKRHLFILWGVRCLVTLGFMLFYERFYVELDAFAYYRSARMQAYFPTFQFMEGTNNVVILLGTIIRWLPILESYHALKVLWSFMGMAGGYFIWRAYALATGEENMKVLWLMCGFPSILFWSSILGKDPIVYLGIGLAAWGAVRMFKTPSMSSMLILFSGVVCVSTIRLWMALCLILAIGIAMVNVSSRGSHVISVLKVSMWIGFFFLAGVFIEKFDLTSQGEFLERINTVSRGWSIGGSYQEVPELATTWDIVRFLPMGVFTALFRPLPGEVNNLFGWLAGFENIILLISTIQVFILIQRQHLEDRSLQFFLCVIATWAFIYSIISYQNLGSAVRFKIQVLPFMILLPYYLRARIKQAEDQKRIWVSGGTQAPKLD